MLIGLETSKTVAAILELQIRSTEKEKRGESCVCVFQEAEHGLLLVKPSSLVGGACEGIATGFVKRKGASRRTRHVDTKVYFMQARTMEPESCRLAHEDHNCSNGSSQSSRTLTDAAISRTSMRGCGKSLPTKSLHMT